MNEQGHTPSSHQEDSALARQVAHGDVAAFTLLYDRYATRVYTMAVHMLGVTEADELVQEVFLRLWLKADQYDPDRGSFPSWFMTIARHCILRELGTRTRQRRVQTAGDIEQILLRVADATADVEEQAWRHDQAQSLARELGGLPAEQRHVLTLAYFGGLSQSAIAQHLDLPLGTVKKRTRLGLQKLRRALEPGREPGPRVTDTDTGESISALSKARITDGL